MSTYAEAQLVEPTIAPLPSRVQSDYRFQAAIATWIYTISRMSAPASEMAGRVRKRSTGSASGSGAEPRLGSLRAGALNKTARAKRGPRLWGRGRMVERGGPGVAPRENTAAHAEADQKSATTKAQLAEQKRHQPRDLSHHGAVRASARAPRGSGGRPPGKHSGPRGSRSKIGDHQGPARGAMGIRTPDLLHAMEARYQLRHSPARLRGRSSRSAPPVYRTPGVGLESSGVRLRCRCGRR